MSKQASVLLSDQMANRDCRKHNFVIKETLRQIGLAHYGDINYAINLRTFSPDVQGKLMHMHILDWQTQINRESSRSGNYEHTNYLKQNMWLKIIVKCLPQ